MCVCLSAKFFFEQNCFGLYTLASLVFACTCRMTADEKQLIRQIEESVRVMLSGFSVGMYGVGSKITVLDGIAATLHQSKERIVRVRGYDQMFPMIRSFAAVVCTSKRANIRTQTQLLDHISANPDHRLFVLIDSIDGAPVQGFQDFFAKLACLENVCVCATVDHCRVGLLWSPSQLRKFQWYWIEANTYHAYEREVADLVPFWEGVIENKAEVASKNFSIVINSLTKNHRLLCVTLAHMQLEQKGQIRSTDLLKLCKKDLIATTQTRMRGLMQELIDHRLVLYAKEKETGNELFWIPFDDEKLQQIKTHQDIN